MSGRNGKGTLAPSAAAPQASSVTGPVALKLAANLRVLQRLDRSILDILVSASHVAMYSLTAGASPTWEKKDVEGSLFIVKVSPPKGPEGGPKEKGEQRQ